MLNIIEPTLCLDEAAKILKMTPEGLRLKLLKKQIPGAKIGRRWILVTSDLVEYIRSRYCSEAETTSGVVQTVRRTKWHSTKDAIHGGLTSTTMASEYKDLLTQRTKN